MKTYNYKKGFTLHEIVIVVSIMGCLCALATPNLMNATKQARTKCFISQLRMATGAFTQYMQEHDKYPADGTPGQVPAGMEIYLSKIDWSGMTPVGGSWDWDCDQFGVKAAVSVSNPNWTQDDMITIDKSIDDGNLSSGQFRERASGYMFVIEEAQ